MNFIKWFARNEYKCKLGHGWLSLVYGVIIMAIGIRTFGLPDWLIPLAAGSYVIFTWIGGDLIVRHGIQEAENDYASSLNPALVRIEDKK